VNGLTLHELYHMVELRFDAFRDADWDQQFTGYFGDYSSADATADGNPGFLNAYAQTFPHEDRAELFSALLLRPDEIVTRIRTTNDAVLRRKVVYMDQKSQNLLGLKLAPGGL
jgi:hypothetical protein